MVELTTATSKVRARLNALARGLPDLLVAEYKAGDDMQLPAKTWSLHRTTVAAHLQRAGVALRRQGLSPAQIDQAVTFYAEGWSCQRLGERFSCSAETVRQELKRHGVRLRSPWDRAVGL